MSTLTHLVCSECARQYDPQELHTFCHACNAPLLAQYDIAAAGRTLTRASVAARPKGMWRWSELLPIRHPAICRDRRGRCESTRNHGCG